MRLEDLRWKRRLLIAAGTDEAAHRAFEDVLEAREAALDERHVDVYRLEGTQLRALGGDAPALEALAPATRTRLLGRSDPAAEAVGAHALGSDRQDPFMLVLLGKDGEVKRRATSPNALDELLRLIDTMPMRQDEMLEDGS